MNNSQPTTSLLDQGEPISIAQLSPDVPSEDARVIIGTVTITWPFSILNKSIAFLLAERDFRLRRQNGQVRIRFHGAAARAIADTSLGAGDEVRVSLQGVKWEKNETQTQVAGSTLAWQLEFSNRLVLGIRRPGEERDTLLNIDAPDAETGVATTNGQIDNTDQVDTLTSVPERPATPTPLSPEATLPLKRTASSTLDPLEFASPAFLKRARVSYGALFEGDMDMLDDEVGRTKSKKRTRFSLPANSWRYTSRSPSPENDHEEEDKEESYMSSVSQCNGETEDTTTNTPPRPAMVDQGSQTVYVDFTPMASVQVLAESRPAFGLTQTTPTPLTRTRPFERDDSLMNQSLPLAEDSTTPQGMPQGTDEYLLDHTPNNTNTDMPFSFTPQTVLFPQAPGYFSGESSRDIVTNSTSFVSRGVDYPAEFLETENLPQNAVEALAGLAGHESAFHSTFAVTSQPPQTAWAVESSPGPRSVVASSDAENPVEILSSSPLREPGSPESSRDRQLSPSRENTGINTTANVSPQPTLEEPASEAEYYRDGGDEPGDDYDLRKYSRTHDDDDDIETSEEEPDLDTNDPDTQTMNPDEDDADGDEDGVNQEEYLDDEYPDTYEQRSDIEAEEYEGSEGDAEGEYDSDEYDYYDEDGAEEEADNRPSATLVSREPIVIDLLSDSEDEETSAPEPEPETTIDAEAKNTDDNSALGIEEAGTSPMSKIEGDSEVPKTDETMAEEESQRLARLDTDEEPLSSSSKEGGQEIETQRVDSGQMDSMNEGQVPTSYIEGSTKNEAEVTEATICANKLRGDSEIIDKAKSPAPSTALRESRIAEELQPRGYEAGKESNPMETEACDIDMGNAPPLQGEAKGHETKDIASIQSAETEPLGETAVEPEVAVEAMDIDELPRRPTPTAEIPQANVDTSEQVDTATTETHYEALTHPQEPSQQPQETLYDDARSSNFRKTVPLSGESQSVASEIQENIESQTSQDLEHSETHENISDRMSEVATNPASHMVNALYQADRDEVEKTSDEAQPENGGQLSPPPTQNPEVQTPPEDGIKFSRNSSIEHLPTPGGTQRMIEVETVDTLSVVTHARQITEEEDDEGPEGQIMAEILQQSPMRSETHLPTDPALSTVLSQTRSPDPTGPADRSLIGSFQDTEAASEVIVAKSLRPRRHRLTKSSGGNDHDDPSLAFITATPTLKTTDRGSKPSSPATSSSKTRSKTHHDDPSIQLAGGSVQADTKSKGKRRATDDESIHSVDNNSPGSQRVLRSRNDHGDPSILLAKGSSPSTRQTRSQKTPDPKRETPRRETRSVSRSFHRQDESPNMSFASLKSPSIAGSTATVPEEEDVKTLKMQLVKSLRTNLPDFLSLKMLSRNSIDKTTDILAVITQSPLPPHRPKHGPRDFMLTLSMIDPSTAPTQVRVAHVFRPHLTSLPDVESGDVILLRRVKVVSMKGRGFGVRSEDGSSWAVSKYNEREILTQVKGPPIEITPEEIEYAKGLRHWWSLQDDNAMGKIETASRKVTEAGKENAK
ncbi:hypothetical protein H9Q72_012069 [Fusarium xylarioides]|uniref:Telomeric single stranded DNA binding POT1/Cdc13 domain-containing protein n=1 Tax=Fusarium xylarioides TaxID=221167 RepID=A0A9P7HHP3_9HYPO|nr:hypothetical protein H9Q70_000307 [Fusarium xylarioides]KAG5759810.1 hypothetical protein H9Q72_012069 [Fusarium xylarioides]KAG5781547.1 hypothetical protein H9Q73_004788 [Fusarium xylarioides]